MAKIGIGLIVDLKCFRQIQIVLKQENLLSVKLLSVNSQYNLNDINKSRLKYFKIQLTELKIV